METTEKRKERKVITHRKERKVGILSRKNLVVFFFFNLDHEEENVLRVHTVTHIPMPQPPQET